MGVHLNSDGSISVKMLSSDGLRHQYDRDTSVARSDSTLDFDAHKSQLEYRVSFDSSFDKPRLVSTPYEDLYSDDLVSVQLPCILDNSIRPFEKLGIEISGVTPDEATFTDDGGHNFRLHMLMQYGIGGNPRFLFYGRLYNPYDDIEGTPLLIQPVGVSDAHSWQDDIVRFSKMLGSYLDSPVSKLAKEYSESSTSLGDFSIPLLTRDNEIVNGKVLLGDFEANSFLLRFDSSIKLDSFDGVKLYARPDSPVLANMPVDMVLRLNEDAEVARAYAEYDLAVDLEQRNTVSTRVFDSRDSKPIPVPSFDVSDNSPQYSMLVEQLKKNAEIEHAYAELDEERKAMIDADYTRALHSYSDMKREHVSDIAFLDYMNIAATILDGDVPDAMPLFDDSWKDFAAYLGTAGQDCTGESHAVGTALSREIDSRLREENTKNIDASNQYDNGDIGK